MLVRNCATLARPVATLLDADLLHRLIRLNHERAAEQQGHIPTCAPPTKSPVLSTRNFMYWPKQPIRPLPGQVLSREETPPSPSPPSWPSRCRPCATCCGKAASH